MPNNCHLAHAVLMVCALCYSWAGVWASGLHAHGPFPHTAHNKLIRPIPLNHVRADDAHYNNNNDNAACSAQLRPLTTKENRQSLHPQGLTFPLASLSIGERGRVVVEPAWGTNHDTPTENNEGVQIHETDTLPCGTHSVPPGTSHTFTSPNFPDAYPHNVRCMWTFQAEEGGEMGLRCDTFKLANRGDYLSIKSKTTGRFVRYRWRKAPLVERTEGGVLWVVFRSDDRLAGNGFRCTLSYLDATTVPFTTTAPFSTTTAPSSTTTAPSSTTIAPSSTTTAPSSTTTAPFFSTDFPLSHPDCGITNTRIVNGVETEAHQYPWMVWLNMMWDDGKSRMCGGSIIFPSWILTAAHCPFRSSPDHSSVMLPITVTVRVGAHSLELFDLEGGYLVEVRRVVIHPRMSITHDVALMELVTPLRLSQTVTPVCLPPPSWATDDMVMTPLTGIGWGLTEEGQLAPRLRGYQTTGYNFQECRKDYGDWMQRTQMCTDGSKSGHICSGDSGGPIMVLGFSAGEGEQGSNGKIPGGVARVQGGVPRVVQVGVVSFGSSSGCNTTKPDGHARVAALVDWIRNTTGINF